MLKRSRWRPAQASGEAHRRAANAGLRSWCVVNLRTDRAYLLKEDFQSLWGYVSPYWAGQFLDRWCTRTMRSRLDPMKEVARMVALAPRPDSELTFRARGQFSSGVVEGFNGKARVITKRAYGFRTSGALEVALYHALGDGARTKTHPQMLHDDLPRWRARSGLCWFMSGRTNRTSPGKPPEREQ